MHGIPENLELSQFENSTLSQICLGEFIIYFNFDSLASISIEGAWILKNSDGELIDQSICNSETNSDRQYYKLHVLLGKKVVSSSIEVPKSFSLLFEGNYELTFIDDSKKYETISIQPGDIFI